MIRQRGEKYHYQFSKGGKKYYGVCEGCTTKRDAEAYEKRVKSVVDKASEQRDVKQLVETFRDELSGGHRILIADAFDLSLKKPRRRQPSERVIEQKRSVWRDFVAFMEKQHPEATDLAAVNASHAEEYIALIRATGRFQKTNEYSRGGKTISREYSIVPSNRTATLFQTTCTEVFRLLARDAGIADNPFDGIAKPPKVEETREAFSREELRLIYDNLDDFTRPLFTVAICTALREGDICTLRWRDINERELLIRRVMNKTGNMVEIPITPKLLDYLKKQRKDPDAEYVFPQLAEMYRTNPSGVSYRVKQFLERIGIETTRVPKGRSRAVSVKDLHSCRHTFCYYAGMQGIPLAVVQSIVGHMTPEMTRHYSAHATLQDKRENMEQMEEFTTRPLMTSKEGFFLDFPLAALPASRETPPARDDQELHDRGELHWLVDIMPIEHVRAVLEFINSELRSSI